MDKQKSEDNFSDDDLDDLPIATLNEIEQNALHFTQHQRKTQATQPLDSPIQHDSRAGQILNAPRPAQYVFKPQNTHTNQKKQPPSSDYGDFDDDDFGADDAEVLDGGHLSPTLRESTFVPRTL